MEKGARLTFALQLRYVPARPTPTANNQYDLRGSVPRVHEKCQKNTRCHGPAAWRAAGAFHIDPELKKKKKKKSPLPDGNLSCFMIQSQEVARSVSP